MAKAILVMDMPETCADCFLNPDNHGCVGNGNSIIHYAMDDEPRRSPDCPLIPAIGYVEPVGNMVSWEDDGDGKN